LEAVRESDGVVVAVDDDTIGEAGGLLARRGLFVEPAAAAAIAVPRDGLTVAVLTGHGAKS
jgi:threonine synthase